MARKAFRALIVGAAPSAGSVSLLTDCASGFDYLIAADGGAAIFLESGVIPDLLIGDLDSIDPAVRDELVRAGVTVRVAPREKDVTDLDLAFDAARLAGAEVVAVMSTFSGRLDHTLGAFGALLRNADLKPEILEPHQHGWVLHSEHRPALTVGGSGSTVSVVALAEQCSVSVTGVRWPLYNHQLAALSSLGVSNVIGPEGRARFEVHRGCAVVLTAEVGGAPLASELPVD